MEEIPVSDFKALCLRLIEKVRTTGVTLLITKNGKPAAVVGPPPNGIPRTVVAGALKNRAKVLGDIVSPSSTEDWEALR